jgi:predicted polyphosphate/ATP-dependent NAD kinase
LRIGFIVNPVAGTGGLAGLKGTDNIFFKAVKKGGIPLSYRKAYLFLKGLSSFLCNSNMRFEIITPPSYMGYSLVKPFFHKCSNVQVRVTKTLKLDTFPSTRYHTLKAIGEMISENVDLIVFTGGDGTARDILEAMEEINIPVLGIPAGVKVFSAVFAYTPIDATVIVHSFMENSENIKVEFREIVDWDSKDNGRFRIYGYLPVIIREDLIQPSKSPGCYNDLEGAIDYIVEFMHDKPATLFLTGPGRTVKLIHERINVPYTLFGVDALENGHIKGLDLNYNDILELIKGREEFYIVITPIGGQGVLFGRGNHQFGPVVLERLKPGNLLVISSECKLRGIRRLKIDTGYPEIDNKFKGYIRVITGYMEERVVPVE